MFEGWQLNKPVVDWEGDDPNEGQFFWFHPELWSRGLGPYHDEEFHHGHVAICPTYYLPDEADELCHRLKNETKWEHKSMSWYGESVLLPRLTAWYGDENLRRYDYAGTKNEGKPWTPLLADMRDRLQLMTRCEFNSVFLNLYRTGEDYIGFHADDEEDLFGAEPTIASLSFGARRKFVFRRKGAMRKYDSTRCTYYLDHGSLLMMGGKTQANWEHSIPKQKGAGPRINLTFRKVITK